VSIINQDFIDRVLFTLDLTKDQVNFENFLEFIDFNGLGEPEFKEWDLVQALWEDWNNK